VTAPPRTDPPSLPIPRTGWATRRTPLPIAAALVTLIAAAVLVGLVHRPSQSQRAADLRGFLAAMTTDIQSCAGGVRESLFALGQIESGASHDRPTAIKIAQTGAANCSPANNELVVDLQEYQVTESLASFHLDNVVTGLVTWATPDAQQVQTDVARVLAATDQQAKARYLASLRQDLATLDARRSAIDSMIQSASRSLSANAAPPRLPG
jgi:hypothetical protein